MPYEKKNPSVGGGYKTFKKQIRKEANEKFKAGQVVKKHKFKKEKKKQFKKDYETGSYQ